MKSDEYPYPDLVDNICWALVEYGPYVHAWTRSSVYIHFSNLPQGHTHKMRISNHDERARYGYKWQLRLDGVDNVTDPREYSKYFEDEDELVEAFESYYKTAQVRPKEKRWGL